MAPEQETRAPDPRRPLTSGISPQPPLFLARETYRHRRLIDVARMLPFFVGALWLVPMFWTPEHSTAMGLLYLFGVWLTVIVVSAVLARRLTPTKSPEPVAGGRDLSE